MKDDRNGSSMNVKTRLYRIMSFVSVPVILMTMMSMPAVAGTAYAVDGNPSQNTGETTDPSQPPDPSTVDRSKLQASIGKAKALNDKGQGKYTANSWGAFTGALSNAEVMEANETATQTDIDGVQAALDASMQNLAVQMYKVTIYYSVSRQPSMMNVASGDMFVFIPNAIEGYKFEGFYLDSGFTQQLPAEYPITQDTNVFALYEEEKENTPKQWTVRFHYNHVENDSNEDKTSDMVVNDGDKIDKSKVVSWPAPSGYSFVNWNTDPNGNGTVVNFDSYKITGGLDLYAQWRKDERKIITTPLKTDKNKDEDRKTSPDGNAPVKQVKDNPFDHYSVVMILIGSFMSGVLAIGSILISF